MEKINSGHTEAQTEPHPAVTVSLDKIDGLPRALEANTHFLFIKYIIWQSLGKKHCT